MKRLLKSIFLLICVACFSLEISGSALAVNAEQTKVEQEADILRYEHVMGVSSTIDINQSSGRVTCNMAAVCRHTTDTLEVTLILQKLSYDAWIPVKTWTASDTQAISMTRYYYILDEGTYRVRVITDVYDESGNFVESIPTKSATAVYSKN